MTDLDTMTMETLMNKPTYLERKRQAILEIGYNYVKFRSRTKKSLLQLKSIIKNNAHHFECHIERSRNGHEKSGFLPKSILSEDEGQE